MPAMISRKCGFGFRSAAELAGSRVGTEELVQEVTVAMLDIDKVGTDIPGDSGRTHIVFDQ
jgi:hypothetical protein